MRVGPANRLRQGYGGPPERFAREGGSRTLRTRHQYNVECTKIKPPPDISRFMILKALLLTVAIAVLYVLHQDIWFWRTAHPLVFGFLPIGLAYHGAYCILAAALMWALTRCARLDQLQRSTL